MSSDSQSSFIEATADDDQPPSSPSELDSLPSSPTTSSLDADSDDGEETDAEREWKESLQQLELLLTMVVVPYMGKYFGRKCAYWGKSVLVTTDDIVEANADGNLCRLGEVHAVEIPG